MDTAIPSNSAVQAAKEKRDRLRKIGPTGDDYISLSVTKRSEVNQGPHPDSRLVREEDELGEGDDGMLSRQSWSTVFTKLQSTLSTLALKNE